MGGLEVIEFVDLALQHSERFPKTLKIYINR
jgi:hypothetical protein